MYDKLLEIFYYFVPGGSLTLLLMYKYWGTIADIGFIKYALQSQAFFILTFILVSIVAGLLIEGLTKSIIKEVITEYLIFRVLFKANFTRKYKINRWLHFKQQNSLPIFFSSRSAFFRHFILVFTLAAVIFRNYWLEFAIGAIISFIFQIYYSVKENRVLAGYADDYNKNDLE